MYRNDGVWGEWKLSSETESKLKALLANSSGVNQKTDSDFSACWTFINNYKFPTDAKEIEPTTLKGGKDSHPEVEEIISLMLESIEANHDFQEYKLTEISDECLCHIFSIVQTGLSEAGFSNICRILSKWEDPRIINACFDYVILGKLIQNEEATLSTINAVTELAKYKPNELSKCVIKLITSSPNCCAGEELLKNVFVDLPDCQRELIVKAIISIEDFDENHWGLLQVVAMKTTQRSLSDIVIFMKCKSKIYAKSHTFTRLLLNICKNAPSSFCKDELIRIAEDNETLLKRQALKYLSHS